MQTTSFRIWTRTAESTSNDDNRYTTSASICKLFVSTLNVWLNKDYKLL